MKILFFNQTGEVGGAEVSLLDNLAFLGGRGHELLIAAPQDGPLLERAAVRGASVFPVDCRQIRMSAGSLTLPRYAAVTLRNAVAFGNLARKLRPDIIHGNTTRAGLIASLAPAPDAPVIWHIRDQSPDSITSSLVRGAASARAAAVIANSNFTASDFSVSGPLKAKTRIVYNGFDFARFAAPDAASRNTVRASLGASPDDILVLQIGYIGEIKNQHITIEAMATAVREFPNLRLAVIGKPLFKKENEDYERRILELVAEKGLADRVTFTGYVPDAAAAYTASDIVVCPSRMESFCRVAVEGAAAGKPVVATRVGGIPEIITHGETGLLLDSPPQPRTLTESILKLAADPALRASMGEAARASVASKFSSERLVNSLESVYKEILEHGILKGAKGK